MMNKQDFHNKLLELLAEFTRLREASKSNEARFKQQLDRVKDMENVWEKALRESARKALDDRKLLNKDVKPGGDGWTFETCYRNADRPIHGFSKDEFEALTKGFWTKSLPFNPFNWAQYEYNISYLYANSPEPTQPQDEDERVLSAYAAPRILDEWLDNELQDVLLEDAQDQADVLGRVKAALDRVEADLLAITQGADSGGDTQAGEGELSEGEWSKPMSKAKMMAALGIDSYKTFNAFARRHGIEQAGNRQTFMIRLDSMDARSRSKLEKA